MTNCFNCNTRRTTEETTRHIFVPAAIGVPGGMWTSARDYRRRPRYEQGRDTRSRFQSLQKFQVTVQPISKSTCRLRIIVLQPRRRYIDTHTFPIQLIKAIHRPPPLDVTANQTNPSNSKDSPSPLPDNRRRPEDARVSFRVLILLRSTPCPVRR